MDKNKEILNERDLSDWKKEAGIETIKSDGQYERYSDGQRIENVTCTFTWTGFKCCFWGYLASDEKDFLATIEKLALLRQYSSFEKKPGDKRIETHDQADVFKLFTSARFIEERDKDVYRLIFDTNKTKKIIFQSRRPWETRRDDDNLVGVSARFAFAAIPLDAKKLPRE
jgi:hypothetical protein